MDDEERKSNQYLLARIRALIAHGKQTVLEVKQICEQTREHVERSLMKLSADEGSLSGDGQK